MELNIRAGMRVLYKNGNSNWLIGTTAVANAELNNLGLYIPIVPKGMTEDEEIHYAEINQIFWDAFPLENWIKDYPKYFMTKEDYIKFIESDEFDKRLENACVSDGEYGYYPVSKYSRQWLEKQPFNYVIRSD
jgi:hypothetical protein